MSRVAGQTIAVPDVTGAFGEAHWAVKVVIVVALIYVGLDLAGRWTGHYLGNVSFTGLNPIGEQINASQATLSQLRAPDAGFNRVHSQ
jgi:hypothetical protein